ncbi:beta-propeller fold lactonase family protein [Spirosoma sp. BT702]|uniref:Beta-propeller fold lactonase family protein n=1 Tax=Spirosoma profusum TaxID=2771354 RepID=A0A926Y353_9BACT|nr:putative Ig domain-containing protein [Spirosoma profusum]MBD2701451.1 beta-propeller fold lactonase family protein [Spirosoma profusum]
MKPFFTYCFVIACLLMIAFSQQTLAQCAASVNPISNLTLCNGTASGAITFSGSTDSYSWTNSNPSIGLPASGTGNISSFTAMNGGNTPQQAIITVIPKGILPTVYISTYNPTNDRGTVHVLNSATNVELTSIPVGNLPFGTVISPDGSRIYVTNQLSNNVSVIDAATNTVSATIGVGNRPWGLGISPDGSKVYVANNVSDNLSVINTATNSVIATVSVGNNPQGVGVSLDGSKVYVSNGVDDNVSVINTATNTVLTTISVGDNPLGVRVSPDGSKVYVANINDTKVHVINTATNTVSSTIGVGIGPSNLCFSPDGSKVYVANYESKNVSVINAATSTVLTSINVVSRPLGIAITPDGSKVYVANQASNSVSVIDAATNTVSTTLNFVDIVSGNLGDFVGRAACSGTPESFTITVLPTPTASLISSGTLTCANPSVTLTATGGSLYAFRGPGESTLGILSQSPTSGTALVNSPGLYSVTVTTASGCTTTQSLTVEQNIASSSVSINPSSATLTCTSPTVNLSAVGSGTFRWNTGATTSSISATAGGPYSVTLTGANGCSNTASVSVSADQTPPSVTINPNSATLTCNTSSVSLSAVGSGTFRWNTGATTSGISVSLANTYSVTLTGSNGCTATASASVTYQNCAPTVANAIPPQSATVGNAFSYTIPATTFTDAETPNSLTLVVSGLPAGLSFVSPNTITGTPSTTVGSPFSVTVTATDPGGLSASTSFSLTVQPRSFAITGVTMLDCNHISYYERRINFTVSFEATNGQPISLSAVNEARTVAIHEPYQLNLFTDNPVIVFKARQQGTPGEATFSYNWLAFCANGNPRVENAIPPQSATVGQAFSYTIPATTFTDAETANSLTLSVVGLPEGLSFVAPATIAGTVSASASAFYSVTVTATDPSSGSVDAILPLGVVNPGGCGSMFTLKAGNWNDASVWSCGRIPVFTEAVTLNHTVSLPSTYQAQALRVIYSPTGRLIFGASSRLRLGANYN